MLIRVGLEKNLDNCITAWSLDFPGCYAEGSENSEVMLRLTQALIRFEAWVDIHTDTPWFTLGDMDFRTEEVWQPTLVAENGKRSLARAFFSDDCRLVCKEEMETLQQVYKWQRDELVAGLEIAEMQLMNRQTQIKAIAAAIISMENLLLSKLDYVAEEVPASLSASQEMVQRFMLGMIDDPLVHEIDGELWSCRKVLRLLLWHQRKMIDQIKLLLSE